MVISDTVTYPDLFTALEPVNDRLRGTINPQIYTQREFAKRVKDQNSFITRLLAQPKLWIYGSEHDLPTRAA
jgi:hypothetical protein